MFIFSNSNLPPIFISGTNSTPLITLSQPNNGTNYGSLSIIDFEGVTTSLVINSSVGNFYTITDVNAYKVNSIISNGFVYTEALDPTNVLSGEFIYNSNTATITINSSTPLLTVNVVSLVENIPTLVIPNFSLLLSQIAIEGEISISRSFQEHPSSNVQFTITVDKISSARNAFKIGSELNLYNIPFRVVSYNETFNRSHPGTKINIQVSFQGKWSKYLNKPVSYLPAGSIITNNSELFLDPDCSIIPIGTGSIVDLTSNIESSNIASGSAKNTAISSLAAQAGVNYIGKNYAVKLPENVSRNDTTTIESELTPFLPINSEFIFLSNTQGIEAKLLTSISNFSYSELELLSDFTNNINRESSTKSLLLNINLDNLPINYSGLVPATYTSPPVISLQLEDLSNVAKPEYQNLLLTGKFSEPKAQTENEPIKNNQPKFKPIESKIVTYTKGDLDPTLPPQNITSLKTLTHNFDSSGVTKTTIETTEENSSIIRETVKRYGFAYLAKDIYHEELVTDSIAVFNGNPLSFWKLIEEYTTTYLYDPTRGYLIGSDTTGKRLLRFIKEQDDNAETIELSQNNNEGGSVEALKFKAYSFNWFPLQKRTRYLLKQHRDFFKNFENQDEVIIYKQCNRDGTSDLKFVYDPNYLEPMFVAIESSETICCGWTDDPESTPEDPSPLLTTGEETYFRKFLTVLASDNTVSTSVVDSVNKPVDDRYVEFTSNFSTQDPGFGSVCESTSTSENSGQPPVATRKNFKFELIEDKETENTFVPIEYEHVVYTNPFNGIYPKGGSLSFEKAETVNAALVGATTQLKIDDIRNTLSSSVTVPANLNIKEGDIVEITINNIKHKRRVLGATTNLGFQTTRNELIVVSNGTVLNLGLERDLTGWVKYNRTKKPTPPKSPTNNSNKLEITLIEHEDFTLGNLLSLDLQNRGNIK